MSTSPERSAPGDPEVPGGQQAQSRREVQRDQEIPSAQERRARLSIHSVPALPVDREALERLQARAQRHHEALSRLLLPAILADLEAREDQEFLNGPWDPVARAHRRLPEDQ